MKSLNSYFYIIVIISAIFLIEAITLSIISLKFDLFIFCQILTFPILIILMIISYKILENTKTGIFIINIFVITLFIRVIAVIIVYWLLWNLQGGPFEWGWAPDDYTYHLAALFFAQNPNVSLRDLSYSLGLSEVYSLYPYLVSFLYRFFYPHTLIARIANAFISSLSSILFYLFIKNLGIKEKIAKLATCFYVFSPGFIYFSSLQLKDALLLFICFLLLYLLTLLLRTNNIIKFTFLTFIYFSLSFCFFYIRRQFFFVFAFYYLVFLTYNLFSLQRRKKIAILFLIGIFMLFMFNRLSYIITKYGVVLDSSYISYEFQRYEKWKITSIFGELVPFITSLLGFFLPFPTLVYLPHPVANYPTDILKIPVDMEIFFTSIITVYVIFSKYKNSNLGFKIILMMTVILYLGLLASNYVSYERHRLLLTATNFILVAYGIEDGVNSKKILFVCFLVSLFVFFYSIIRIKAAGIL